MKKQLIDIGFIFRKHGRVNVANTEHEKNENGKQPKINRPVKIIRNRKTPLRPLKSLNDEIFSKKRDAEEEEIVWERYYNQLIQHKMKNGNCKFPYSDRKMKGSLAAWAWQQKGLKSKGTITKKHYDLLCTVGFFRDENNKTAETDEIKADAPQISPSINETIN